MALSPFVYDAIDLMRVDVFHERLKGRWPSIGPTDSRMLLIICGGYTSHSEMANRLHVSMNTTKCYLRRALDRLGTCSVEQAVVMVWPYYSDLRPEERYDT